MRILAALLLDVIFGDPKNSPHPVAFIGKLITFYEKIFYSKKRGKLRGFLFCCAVLASVCCVVACLLGTARRVGGGVYVAAELYLLYAALAFKSLKDETLPVAQAAAAGDIERARKAVSRVVGRDVEPLDMAGVIRAAVETIAESYIDGVFSVLFWMTAGSFFGACALFAWFFKAASTMDSMVGYDDERYRDFGFAAAKLDDILNFIPARLGACVAVCAGALAGMDYKCAWITFLRDRLKHKSPNSAHGESVFAGLLGIRLGGGAYYGGVWETRPYLGDGEREPEPNDILRSHHILNLSVAICALLIFLTTGGV